jgi:hypothetical protein
MAIVADATPPPLAVTYTPVVPGVPLNPPENVCVYAGDRIILVSETLTNPAGAMQPDVVPDGTAGQGAGYMPHWVYRPYWCRRQDVFDPPVDAGGNVVKLYDGVNGPAGVGPTIRVDLQYLYCPWAGTVTIEGGSGPPSGIACPILLSFLWDQQARQRSGWWGTAAEIARRIRGETRNWSPVKMPRFPVDARLAARMTLTFYNAFAGGRALSIERPECASSVWTPDQQVLILDNGPGTTSVTVTVNGESNRAELGCFSRVTANAGNVAMIIFGIEL